jgi:intracellular septation protein
MYPPIAQPASASDARQKRRSLPKGFRCALLRHLLIEVGPLLVFFLAYIWLGLITATAAYAVCTAASVTAAWTLNRRLPILPLVSTGLVLALAGLSVALEDETFIKIKPTVVNGFFAAVLGIGWLMNFRLVERVLDPLVQLDAEGVRILTVRTIVYLLCLALVNEAIWRTFTVEVWIGFKIFASIVLNVLFALSQLPVVRAHRLRRRPTID